MIIVAFLFDLRLWTGIDSSPLSETEAYHRFVTRRNLVRKLNQQLSTSTIKNCYPRIPLTQQLYEQLSNTPPWTEIRRGSDLHRLKRDVLALLRNKQRDAGITLYIDVSEVEHFYTWDEPDNFFPPALAAMQESWIEMVGICAFDHTISAREFDQPVPILGSCIITASPDVPNARILRRSVVDMNGDEPEEKNILFLFQADGWIWEQWVRQCLWGDERLPFGPIGFSPPDTWHPGESPRRYQNAYRDSLGGLWEWEGGRAVNNRNPFGGHWNVQLSDARVKHDWVHWIEECTGKKIRTRLQLITHVNIEPDGNICDNTFDWDDT
ncbi:MAG: hypothetical protein H8D34_31140 [Chloroflexi bacterium]|nr:hypothetical protein [Chloroflexota bacterium]